MRNHKQFITTMFLVGAFAFAFVAKSSTAWAQEVKNPPTVPIIRVYDNYPHPSTSGAVRYALAEKWNKTDLTYQFNNCPSLVDCGQAQNAVRQSFADWAAVSVLTFTEVSSGADMEVTWAGEEEGMGVESDTLGFAYFPDSGGDMWLNDTIEWEIGTGTDSDLYLTAAHEIGHALGLDHSEDPASLMFPTSTSQTSGIADDDIQGIQALYGASDGTAPTLDIDEAPETIVTDDTSSDSVDADGALNNDTPYELWDIEVEEGETLIISMATVEGDLMPQLAILSEDEETVLAESRSDGESEAYVTVTFPDAGTYIILATRDGEEDGSTQGSYTLAIETATTTTDMSTVESDTVEVINYAYSDLCEIYVSSSDSEEWGDDLLKGESLPDGETVSGEFDAGSYDVLAVTCDEAIIEAYGLLISEESSIEIYEDTVAVYP